MTKPPSIELEAHYREALDELSHEIALHEMEHGDTAPEDIAWTERLTVLMKAQVAAMRYRRDRAPTMTFSPVQITTMTRDEILTAIQDLTRTAPTEYQFDQLELHTFTDLELQSILWELVAPESSPRP